MLKRLSLLALAFPAVAAADPCTAPVKGFHAGQTFAGQVRCVADGDSICVGPGRDPRTWVEVRLADFYAPELHDAGGTQASARRIIVADVARAVPAPAPPRSATG